MASELTVQTIRGPLSGANANQILIPAGQTIVAPAGGLIAPGQIIQVVQSQTQTNISTSSSTNVASGFTISITPKYTNSKILFMLMGGTSTYGSTSVDLNVDLYYSVAGGAYNKLYDLAYMHQTSTWRLPYASSYMHSPNTTQTLIYQPYFFETGSNIGYLTTSESVLSMTVMEIAQ